MGPAEFSAAQQAVRVTDPETAALLGVSIERVAAWKSGTAPVPRDIALHLEHIVQSERDDRALASSGHAVCSWEPDQAFFKDRDAAKPHSRLERAVRAHLAMCDTCKAHERLVAARLRETASDTSATWIVHVIGIALIGGALLAASFASSLGLSSSAAVDAFLGSCAVVLASYLWWRRSRHARGRG